MRSWWFWILLSTSSMRFRGLSLGDRSIVRRAASLALPFSSGGAPFEVPGARPVVALADACDGRVVRDDCEERVDLTVSGDSARGVCGSGGGLFSPSGWFTGGTCVAAMAAREFRVVRAIDIQVFSGV